MYQIGTLEKKNDKFYKYGTELFDVQWRISVNINRDSLKICLLLFSDIEFLLVTAYLLQEHY